MKNLSYLFLVLLTAAGMTACYEEEPIIDAEEGVVVTPENISSGIFDLTDLDNAATSFDVTTVGVPVNSVTIFKSLNGGDRVQHATVSSVPSTVSITVEEALDGLAKTPDELVVGDVVTFSFETATQDGRTLQTGGNSVNITASCPSNLAGTYDVVAVGTSTDGCCPDQTTVTSTVTLTDQGSGRYGISDFSGGLYLEWYDVYGITSTADSPGTIVDVCNNLTFVDTNEPFQTAVTGTGSVDGATGVITLSWTNGYDDEGTLTLTPQ